MTSLSTDDGNGLEAAAAVNGGELVSRAEFARRVGVVKSAITLAVQTGRISGAALGPGKKLRFVTAEAQWKRNRDPQAELGVPDPNGAVGDLGDDDDLNYKTERTLYVRAQREQLDRENALKDGLLVLVSDVESAMVTCGREIRQQLDLIETWADGLASVTGGDLKAIRGFLKDKIRGLEAELESKLQHLGAGEDDDETED
jgi:phage terminase Nu1 subunit (DNA packaging protein)